MARERYPPEPRRPDPDDYDSRNAFLRRRPRDDSRDRLRGDSIHFDGRAFDRDRDRDRDYQGRPLIDSWTDRDLDIDRGRDRFGDRGRERDILRDPFERDRPSRDLPASSPPSASKWRPSGANSPADIPKGPKADRAAPVSTMPRLPKPPSPRLPDVPRPALRIETRTPVESPKLGSKPDHTGEAKNERDVAARTLDSALRKARELYDYEIERNMLEAAEKRRDQLGQDFADFPSVLDLNARTAKATSSKRESVAADVTKAAQVSINMTKSFVSQILTQAQRDAGKNEVVRSLKVKQEDFGVKLEAGLHKINSTAGQLGTLVRVERENTRLRADVTHLTKLVNNLTAKVETLSKANARTDTEVSRLSARATNDTKHIEGIEAKLVGYDTKLADVELARLRSMIEFLDDERPKLQLDLENQKATTAGLKNDVQALQSKEAERDSAAAAAAAATAAANAATALSATSPTSPAAQGSGGSDKTAAQAAPPSTRNPSFIFPGDDVESLRNEIGILNERLGPIETASATASRLAMQQTKSMALLRVDITKLTNSQSKMGEVFDEMITTESKARAADSNRLAELEKTVHQLRSEPAGHDRGAAPAASTPAPTVAVASEVDKEMNMADSTPAAAAFLSSVPEPADAPPEEEVDLVTQPLLADAANGLPTGTAAASDLRIVGTAKNAESAPSAGVAGSAEHANLLSIRPAADSRARILEALGSDVRALQARLQVAEEAIQSTKLEIEKQCSPLQMMVTSLDTRFNNLTTKDLFNAIVGHMEKLHPNARQLQQDIENIARKIRSMEAFYYNNNNNNGKRNGESDAETALSAKRRRTYATSGAATTAPAPNENGNSARGP